MKRKKRISIIAGITIGILGIMTIAGLMIATNEGTTGILSKTNLKQQNQYEATETSTNTATDLNGITWNYTIDENGKATDVYYESGTLGETVTIPASLSDGINEYPVASLYNSSGGYCRNIFTKTSWRKQYNSEESNHPGQCNEHRRVCIYVL